MEWLGKKQSTISPFINFDLPAGNKTQILDFTNDFILKDSCPFKISTSNFPSLVVLNLLLTNYDGYLNQIIVSGTICDDTYKNYKYLREMIREEKNFDCNKIKAD